MHSCAITSARDVEACQTQLCHHLEQWCMLQTLQAVSCERDSTVRQLSGQVGTDSCASSALGLSCLILTVNVEAAHTVQEPKKNS